MNLSYLASDPGHAQLQRSLAHHAHDHQHGISRRRFVQTAAGLTALGVGMGSRLAAPGGATAAAPGGGDVLPISGGSVAIQTAFGGKLFHVYGPPGADSPDSDPATVGNFSGAVGLAYISGRVTETNRRTGKTRDLPFNDADMRFMQGVFRARDGHVRQGTFAFI